jgi:CRP/FNR family transcriptional regulator
LGLDTLMDRPMRCGAVALDAALVCRIPVDAVVVGSGESRQLRLQLLEQFDDEIARLELQLSVYCLNAPQRLADFILFMAGDSTEVNLPMSHKDIGNYLRLVPETVSRLFARFQQSGWLVIRGHGIAIRDRSALSLAAAEKGPPSNSKGAAAAAA